MKPLEAILTITSLMGLTVGSFGCNGSNGTPGGQGGAGGSREDGGTSTGGSGSGGRGATGGGTGGMAATGSTGGSGALGGTGGGSLGGACVGDYVPGDYPPGVDDVNAWLEITGVTGQPNPRQYKVHVPPSYDCHVPTPLLFCIHGFMQNGVMFCVNGSAGATSGPKGFVDKSNQAGFLLVIPTGAGNSWNAGGCCGDASTNNINDVALFKALVAEVSKHANVDPKRIYATGLSNGGMMSYRLACEAADVFTAVAPGSGGIFTTSCTPSRPISVLDLHGTADTYVPYSQQATSTASIAMRDGCMAATSPATVPASGGDTTCVTRTGCPSGIEVTSCSVAGGGHVWFGDPTCGTGASASTCSQVGANSTFLNNTDAAWNFLKRLSR
jgi:polyhydroxybutyrate depolymerase